MIVCAIGPSLRVHGVPVQGRLLNPMLELHHGNSIIARNDDWHTTQLGGMITSNQVAAIQTSGYAPTDSRESAIILNLDPGSYSAIVKGKNGTIGIASVEVYDLGTASRGDSSHAQLSYVYTSGLVQTGDNVRIGFIVQGDMPARIIVDAIGPSLGVNGKLLDPMLELRDHNDALIAKNDNWHTTQIYGRITSNQSGAIQASGHAPTDSRESAIILNLDPGSYTAIVKRKNNATGIALVKAYALP